MNSDLSINKFSQKRDQQRQEITSALFIVNQTSGVGRSAQEIRALENTFHNQFQPFIPHCLFAVTSSHDEVRQMTSDFLQAFPGPWIILSGGGSGTNRAQIQAIMKEVESGGAHPDDFYMSALRLGSGNIIPKHVGLPADPILALNQIANGLFQGNTLPCCLYRCVCYDNHGRSQTHYGATLAGLGQFGRVPQDVAHWRKTYPRLMAYLLKLIPLETANNWQYIVFSLVRALLCLIQSRRAEEVVVNQGSSITTLRLFAGLLINFDFPSIPFQTGCLINEPHLKLCLIPQMSQRQMLAALSHWRSLDNIILTYDVTPERPIDIHFSDKSQITLAVDEDIFMVPGHIRFEVAPSIRFVTGGG